MPPFVCFKLSIQMALIAVKNNVLLSQLAKQGLTITGAHLPKRFANIVVFPRGYFFGSLSKSKTCLFWFLFFYFLQDDVHVNMDAGASGTPINGLCYSSPSQRRGGAAALGGSFSRNGNSSSSSSNLGYSTRLSCNTTTTTTHLSLPDASPHHHRRECLLVAMHRLLHNCVFAILGGRR